jgi:hypothetical protein
MLTTRICVSFDLFRALFLRRDAVPPATGEAMITKQDTAALEADLAQFCGTETHWRHRTSRLTYTDGVKFLAEKAGAFWLIDLVASHQTARLRREEFQIWTLAVDRDKRPMAVATCQADTNATVLVRQEIEYTDFPLPSVKLYLEDRVLMLPGER